MQFHNLYFNQTLYRHHFFWSLNMPQKQSLMDNLWITYLSKPFFVGHLFLVTILSILNNTEVHIILNICEYHYLVTNSQEWNYFYLSASYICDFFFF